MSLALVQSRALLGLRAPAVTVEVHLANGLPSFTLVGLAEVEVKEARERVRSALQNAGLEFPHNKKITVNLAPADLPKDSGRFDLPIALGILAASGQIPREPLAGYEFIGELGLTGELRPVELERQMLLPQYSTSRLIDRLVDEGLAVRRECKMDKRGLFVEITDAGRDLQKRMWGAYSAAIERHVGSKLSDADAVKLSGLLDRLGCSCPGTGQTVTKEAASAR